jgi:hypothetical protein
LGSLAVLVAVLVAGGVGVASAILSPGLALDLISLWPGLVPAVIALLVVGVRHGWRRRLGAMPQLLTLSWLALGVAAHIDGLPLLPSSAAELEGPANNFTLSSLEVHLVGRLEVTAGGDPELYAVEFIRLGGAVGVAEAEEVSVEETIAVALQDSGTTPFFRYAGWRISLSTQSTWNLDLGGAIGADLTGLLLSEVTADGGGWLRMGSYTLTTPIELRGGAFEVTVPASSAVRILGEARVPPSWVVINGGYRAPTDGEGLVISVVEGASLSIIEA